MMLVEEGRCFLSDPVKLYLSEFGKKRMQVMEGIRPDGSMELGPCKRNITILHLLTHTSGISYGFDEAGTTNPVDRLLAEAGLTIGRLDRAGQRGMTLADAVSAIAQMPLRHQPGSHVREEETQWLYFPSAATPLRACSGTRRGTEHVSPPLLQCDSHLLLAKEPYLKHCLGTFDACLRLKAHVRHPPCTCESLNP